MIAFILLLCLVAAGFVAWQVALFKKSEDVPNITHVASAQRPCGCNACNCAAFCDGSCACDDCECGKTIMEEAPETIVSVETTETVAEEPKVEPLKAEEPKKEEPKKAAKKKRYYKKPANKKPKGDAGK